MEDFLLTAPFPCAHVRTHKYTHLTVSLTLSWNSRRFVLSGVCPDSTLSMVHVFDKHIAQGF